MRSHANPERLHAMAEVGSQPQKPSAMADVMSQTSQNLAPTRCEQVNQGLLDTPEHDFATFMVPHFDLWR